MLIYAGCATVETFSQYPSGTMLFTVECCREFGLDYVPKRARGFGLQLDNVHVAPQEREGVERQRPSR